MSELNGHTTALDKALQVAATREGGNVRRSHNCFIFGEETVGQHTFNMLNLLMLLHPEPSSSLIKGILWHDVAERYTGDIPAPAKSQSNELKKAAKALEKQVEKALDFHVELSPDEDRWLHGIDKLEFFLWASEQKALGNVYVAPRAKQAFERIMNDGQMPEAVKDFARRYCFRLAPDLGEIMRGKEMACHVS